VTPLVKADVFKRDEELVKTTAKTMRISLEAARKHLDDEIARECIWVNEIYQVATRTFEHPNLGPCMQINIRRRDGKVIFRDWRHFQEIKNQLAGPEYEGIEIYPAESRKVDTSNKYHIWVILNTEMRIPFGFQDRLLMDKTDTDLNGLRQRPLPKHEPEARKK